jgi:hypothetical protein
LPSTLVVLGAMHDEAHHVESHLDHHRALAVERFWIVDHRSADGTRELLARQPGSPTTDRRTRCVIRSRCALRR